MQGPTGAPGEPGEPVSSFNYECIGIDHSREFVCYVGYSWATRRERRARNQRRSRRSSKFSKINVETAVT